MFVCLDMTYVVGTVRVVGTYNWSPQLICFISLNAYGMFFILFPEGPHSAWVLVVYDILGTCVTSCQFFNLVIVELLYTQYLFLFQHMFKAGKTSNLIKITFKTLNRVRKALWGGDLVS